jgi:2-succinyl-5-enolpyruvyl-6-hydroxy-3-cyclohexene-1-carboxylate synthase
VITGDLGFQHDVGSLALVATSPVKLRVVVLNDRGGRIFSKLPQRRLLDDDEFEHLMRTPGNLDIESAATAFGCGYRKVDEMPALATAFESDASVIEVPVAG